MAKHWRFHPHDGGYVARLTNDLGVSALTAQVLVARGYRSADAAESFLNPRLSDLHDPDELPGVPEAADRILGAVRAGRRVTIYGDYDVDGVSGTSLLWRCLKLLGAKVDYYIPHRLNEGYGLNADALRKLHAEDPQRLVVTVDCGVTAVAEAELARQLGLELVITDHHQFGDRLPSAAAVVHPRHPEGNYPFGALCGAGVAFKLAWSLCRRLGDGRKASPRMRDYLLTSVGLAAIATIADVVPLLGENRLLVRYGLESLRERATPGLRALLAASGISAEQPLQADNDVAFGIGPRLNAAGRFGQARLAVELLTTTDPARAQELAVYLSELNAERQKAELRIVRQARELLEKHPDWQNAPALVLTHPEWHAGVIGIVAGRLAERFERPVVLIAGGDGAVAPGSARTYGDCNLYAALAACRAHLLAFGGHEAAAGLKIELHRVDAFREAFVEYVAAHHRPRPEDGEIRIDAEVGLEDVTFRAVQELDRLGPFGEGNPRPVFAARNVTLAAPPRRMGAGERHLDLRLAQNGATIRAIAFGRGEWADEIAGAGETISVCFRPNINTFRGYSRVELQLLDWRPEPVASLR
ncbi:MAG: single-stranded-DNA-specific exonuclease RecJ [Planctomycetota bacterium]|nr:MAG: single-stranded-DNA-specific exonuclease RecJ [Planctomycetota bacterium]